MSASPPELWSARRCEVQARLELEAVLKAFVNRHRLESISVEITWVVGERKSLHTIGLERSGHKVVLLPWKRVVAESSRPIGKFLAGVLIERSIPVVRANAQHVIVLRIVEQRGSTLEAHTEPEAVRTLIGACHALTVVMLAAEPEAWLEAAQRTNCDLVTVLYCLHLSGASSGILWYTNTVSANRKSLRALRMVGMRSLSRSSRPPLNISFGEGVVGHAAADESEFFIAGQELLKMCRSPDLVAEEGWKSCAVAPLLFDSECAGVLSLYGREEDAHISFLSDELRAAIPVATLHAARRSRIASRETDADRLMKGVMRLQAGLTMVGLVHDLARHAKRVHDWASQLREPLKTLSLRAGLTETVDDMIQSADLVGRLTSTMDKLTLGHHDHNRKVAIHEKLEALEPLLLRLDSRVQLVVEGKATIIGPESVIERIVLNLVVNSIQWTTDEARSITVRFGRRPGENIAVLEVVDNGQGMSEEQILVVRDAFESFRENGSGLGLYLVDQLCKQVGARMAIASTPHRSTTVTIRFTKLIDGVGSP